MSPAIKIISGIMVVLTVSLLVVSFFSHPALIPALLLSLITVACYLRAPVAYYVSGTGLTVRFRLGRKSFGRIIRHSEIDDSPGMSIRLFGNGGLFAGTGIFWNRTWGIFRAYVTTSNRSNLLLLETETNKVLISPTNPKELLDHLKAGE